MRRLIAGLVTTAALTFVGTAAAVPSDPGGAFAPNCHGFDVSYTVHTFGDHGVPTVIAPYTSVQEAQKADQTYCRTGVLLP
jgi:hypothetical protein